MCSRLFKVSVSMRACEAICPSLRVTGPVEFPFAAEICAALRYVYALNERAVDWVGGWLNGWMDVWILIMDDWDVI